MNIRKQLSRVQVGVGDLVNKKPISVENDVIPASARSNPLHPIRAVPVAHLQIPLIECDPHPLR